MEKCPHAKKTVEDLVLDSSFPCIMGQMIVNKVNYHLDHYGSMTSQDTAKDLVLNMWCFINAFSIGSYDSEKDLSGNFFASYIATFPDEKFSSQEEAAFSLHTLLYQMHLYDKSLRNNWAPNVSNDPHSDKFSYSICERAFFVPFMYPLASYKTRYSPVPMLIFNPHELFEVLRQKGKFAKIRDTIRKREKDLIGFVPELLSDYGKGLEYPQYFLPTPDKVEELVWKPLESITGGDLFSA